MLLKLNQVERCRPCQIRWHIPHTVAHCTEGNATKESEKPTTNKVEARESNNIDLPPPPPFGREGKMVIGGGVGSGGKVGRVKIVKHKNSKFLKGIFGYMKIKQN